VPLALGAALLAAVTVRASWHGRFHAAILTATLTAMLLYTAAFRVVLPAIDPLWISPQTAEAVAALRPCAPGPVLLTRFREPSAVFLLGTDTRMMSLAEAEAELSEGKAGLALMVRTAHDRLPTLDPSPRPIACISGFNINGGKHLRLKIATAKPPEAFAACTLPARYTCPAEPTPAKAR
jgi:hypothetical protein